MSSARYVFTVSERLDAERSAWFEGMVIEHMPDGMTRIVGDVADQSALQGVLVRIHSLGLHLVSVNPSDL